MAGRLADPETGRHHHRTAAGDWHFHRLVAGPHWTLAAPAGFGRGCPATGAAPTVLGFYLLIIMGPDGALGRLMENLGLDLLPFTFEGLVLASVIYSLPFTVQPLQNAFVTINQSLLETAATLRASPRDRFFSIVIPLARPGFLTAAVLTFAHTVGEFGVVLMIGGNIPGETKVLSVAIFDHVEALEYTQAHWLSAGMVAFSFVVLVSLYALNGRYQPGVVK